MNRPKRSPSRRRGHSFSWVSRAVLMLVEGVFLTASLVAAPPQAPPAVQEKAKDVEKGKDVPPPEVVNAQKQAKQPRDPLVGIPFVTATAWAVADGRTGEVLWGESASEPRDI